MTTKKSWTKRFFVGLWDTVNFTRRFIFNLIFIFVLIALLIGISNSTDGDIKVEKNSALVLNLKGDIVIQKRYVDPSEQVINEALGQEQENPEVLLADIIEVLENAKLDKRIDTLIISLSGLRSAGFDKLQRVAEAIQDFKSSGKPVYAIADYYGQTQYYLAAQADQVYLNPMGALIIEGYGRYRMYYKDFLENIKASTHVFKVGKFKSAVEPYLRNDMSPEARLANQAWMDELWAQYKIDVANARGMDVDNFDEKLDAVLDKMRAVDGDFASYALENGWVDGLRSRNEFREEMIALLGKSEDEDSYNSVSFNKYLKLITPQIPLPESDKSKVAIVVAKGTILDGSQKAGNIGGDSTAKLLRKARLDDKVKAVVLQVDSGGGSAFASEVIRKEIDLIKAAGKPVVASMSTYAASGGYWISASADKIIAEPSTITGSIGIFGLMMTYEKGLDYIGVNVDGLGTTEFAGMSPFRALDPKIGDLIQLNIERGYKRFITLVANERDMTLEAVDNIAQGRVWIGTQALELGLVDALGSIDDAIAAAAEMAELDDFDTKYVEKSLSPQEQFWQNILKSTASMVSGMNLQTTPSALGQMVKRVDGQLAKFNSLNDPLATYAMCLECEL